MLLFCAFLAHCAYLQSLRRAGAVKRAKLEKEEPHITYEAFVEELDENDAFTSAMIDVLVKVRLLLCSNGWVYANV